MNKALRKRAEVLLVLQEYPICVDSQSLKAATTIAHHHKRFQDKDVAEKWGEYFDALAEMMREKFPRCPCKACVSEPTVGTARTGSSFRGSR